MRYSIVVSGQTFGIYRKYTAIVFSVIIAQNVKVEETSRQLDLC